MKRLVVLVFLLAALDRPLAAQDADSAKKPATPNAAPSQSGPIKVRVELVNVLFTVANKKNHLVIDLEKDDFRVLEDNKPQTIRYFSRETNLPLRIGILVDTSNSIRARLHFEQEAAIDFLDTTLRPATDKAFVVAFDVESQLVQDYTSDVEKLANAIHGLQAGGGTGPHDAADLAANCQEISRELRSQYSLAYVATNQARDGTFRTITIEPREKGMHVRAKQGYFAPPQ